jgi:2-keto-4-pentenoate hydratase
LLANSIANSPWLIDLHPPQILKVIMLESNPRAATAAAILVSRRRSGQQGSRLPEGCRPAGIEAALAIQATVTAQLGDSVAGWKCGLPAADRVVLAPIYASTVQRGPLCAVRVRKGRVRVEPELAFVLGRDLPVREMPYTQAKVDAAVAHTHLALELIDSRYQDGEEISFAEQLADGLVNQGLFIGPKVDSEAASTASELAIRITQAGGEASTLDGKHPGINPRAPLYWLVEFLRSQGESLQAGQAVITGSYAGSIDLPVEEDIAIQFGNLGMLVVRFAEE